MASPNFPEKLKLGTRGSPLALVQAEGIIKALRQKFPQQVIDIVTIQTSGDRFKGERLADAGGKALFVKEIEEALLQKKIDFAVHSMKDLPGVLPERLFLACFPKREDPRDCFISHRHSSFESLAKGACIGTTSPRRQAQILALRPDLVVKPIRGNVDTRLKKLEDKSYDAILLAQAGLNRLQRDDVVRTPFDTTFFIPAVGQGALGIECRVEDEALVKMLAAVLNHPPTELAARAERAFLKKMDGDCYTPLAAHAWVEESQLKIIGWFGTPDGKKKIRIEKKAGLQNPEQLGSELAEEILHENIAH